jgi:PAS domain-containing protein
MDGVFNISPDVNARFHSFYKSALDKIHLGILFINEDGTKAEGNAAFKRIHGWDENKPIVISDSLSEFFTVFDLDYNILDLNH